VSIGLLQAAYLKTICYVSLVDRIFVLPMVILQVRTQLGRWIVVSQLQSPGTVFISDLRSLFISQRRSTARLKTRLFTHASHWRLRAN